MNAMSTPPRGPANADLTALLRGQFHDATNTRYLRGLPIFRTDAPLDDVFDRLLAEMDAAEAAAPRPAKHRA